MLALEPHLCGLRPEESPLLATTRTSRSARQNELIRITLQLIVTSSIGGSGGTCSICGELKSKSPLVGSVKITSGFVALGQVGKL